MSIFCLRYLMILSFISNVLSCKTRTEKQPNDDLATFSVMNEVKGLQLVDQVFLKKMYSDSHSSESVPLGGDYKEKVIGENLRIRMYSPDTYAVASGHVDSIEFKIYVFDKDITLSDAVKERKNKIKRNALFI